MKIVIKVIEGTDTVKNPDRTEIEVSGKILHWIEQLLEEAVKAIRKKT